MALAVCDNCGKKFSKQRKKLESHQHHFCCRNCYSEWMRKNPEFFVYNSKLAWKKKKEKEQWKKKKMALDV